MSTRPNTSTASSGAPSPSSSHNVEVPSLILTPSLAWSQHVFVDPSESEITGLLFLLALGGLLWADPMLEGVFHPHLSSGTFSSRPLSTGDEWDDEWPSKAFYEAHPNPFFLPRQRTKRLWYDLYVSFLDIVLRVSRRYKRWA